MLCIHAKILFREYNTSLITYFMLVFLGLFSDHEDGSDVSRKRWLTFSRLHGVISQNIELFRTSKPTDKYKQQK
jgi:hypothetical protein